MSSREILIETQRVGAILRVTATDAATGTEIVFQAPVSVTKTQLQSLSADKLRYVMNKK